MPFVEELPSAQDIKDFNLPFMLDLEKPIEYRRHWLADRERDLYFHGIGVIGSQAHDEDLSYYASFYIGRKKFRVFLAPVEKPRTVDANPYKIHYPAVLNIKVYVSREGGFIDVDVLPEVRKAPDKAHPLLQNRSLNEFLTLFKEALTQWKAGHSNIDHGNIIVSFGF